MRTKFTIITVCFNSEQTIERTIQSVLNQTYQDYEYIIVDGKSSDRTLDIVRQYEPKFQGKMHVISEKDNGIYDAMNKGIDLATGELIGIVNSDDYYEVDALEKLLRVYDGYEYSIVYGLLRTVKNGQEVMVYLKNHNMLESDMITHPTCFVSNRIYKELGKYSLEYRYSADYEFMLRVKKNPKVRFIEIYELISNFSIDGASASAKAYLETQRLFKEYGIISVKKYHMIAFKTKMAIFLGR